MNKRTKVMLITFLGILIVAILSLNATYSYMKSKTSGDKNTDVKVNSCAKISLKENSNTINLTNMYPMDDEMGLQTDSYDFTVSSTCDNYVGFDLYLTTYASDIDDSTIKYAITSKNDTVLASDILTSMLDGEKDFTDAEKNQLNSGVTAGYKKIYKVFTNNIPLKGESEYKLHIWIDNGNAVDTTMGKSFNIGVSVKSFDRDESMAEYLIKNKDNSLIYHDGKADYKEEVNYELEAEDLSYRYMGKNPNNYICFGGDCSSDSTNDNYLNLYRIIGLFDDDKDGNYNVKLIRADAATTKELGDKSIGATANILGNSSQLNNLQSTYKGDITYLNEVATYFWNRVQNSSGDNSNDWSKSNLNTENLNKFYLSYLEQGNNKEWTNMIEEHAWITIGNIGLNIWAKNAKIIYENEIKFPEIGSSLPTAVKRFQAKIGLMYVSDYMYGAAEENWTTNGLGYNSGVENNWLSVGLHEWTITRQSATTNSEFIVLIDGSVGNSNGDSGHGTVRPAFYLKTNVKMASNSGNGTAESPYIITQ